MTAKTIRKVSAPSSKSGSRSLWASSDAVKMRPGEKRMADSIHTSNGSNSSRDLNWSPREKAAARKAFELALNREKESTIQQAKEKAAKIKDEEIGRAPGMEI